MKKFLLYLAVMSQVILAKEPTGPIWIETAYPLATADASESDTTMPMGWFLDLHDARLANGPLGFTVYPWPMDKNVLLNSRNKLLLVEITTILGAIGVTDFYDDATMEYVAEIAFSAGLAEVVLHTSPFHRTGCDKDPHNWSNTSEEIQRVEDYLLRAKRIFNEKGIKIGSLAFDFECYDEVSPLVTARMDLVYTVAKSVFPDTRLYWYRNGDYGPNTGALHDNITVVHYRPYRAPYTELWMQRWQQKLASDNPWENWQNRDEIWTAWISLGSCYSQIEPNWSWTCPDMQAADWEWFGRYTRSLGEDVLLYPPPYRTFTPGFHEAFLAWYRGATSK